jgi:Rieske 2Fe-2S family protein
MGAGLGTAPEKDTEEYLKKISPWVEDCKKKGIPSETYLETEDGLKQGLNRYFDRTPIGNGHLSQTKSGKPASTLMGKFKDFDGGLSQVSFNPFSCCYFTNDFGVMFVFKPTSTLESEVELIWLVNEDAKEGDDFNVDDITFIWDVTTQEDTMIIENNQKGLLSQSFTPGVLSENESAVTYFYNWYFTNMQLPSS